MLKYSNLITILRGWVNLRLNYRLKGYVSRQYLWTVRWGNVYTTTLLLEVFTQRNFAADFIRLKLNFIFKKQKNRFFAPSFRRLRGNLRTPSIARWKAFNDFLLVTMELFFAISYGWDVISGNLSKSAFLEAGGPLWEQISDRKGRRPPTTVGVRKLEWLPFRVVSKYPQCIVWFYHKARVWRTDRQTDRITWAIACV